MAEKTAKPAEAEAPATYTTPDGRVLPLKTAFEWDESGALVRPAAYVGSDGTVRIEG